MAVAEAIESLSEEVKALKLLGSEVRREHWKASDPSYVALFEERFENIVRYINESGDSYATKFFNITLGNMPTSVIALWNEWVEREGITLPEAGFHNPFKWITSYDAAATLESNYSA